MEIRLAKTAGFCFGVNRAVQLVDRLVDEGAKVATLGPLIHNPQAVERMRSQGVLVVDRVKDVPSGYQVVVRSHGVPRSIYDEIEARGLTLSGCDLPLCEEDPGHCRQGRGGRCGAAGGRQCPTIRRCRASWDTPGERCLFLAICRLFRPGKAPQTPKSRFMQLHRPHFRLQNGEKVRSF